MASSMQLPPVFAPYFNLEAEGRSPSVTTALTAHAHSTCSTQDIPINPHTVFTGRFDLGGEGKRPWYVPNERTIFPRRKVDILKSLVHGRADPGSAGLANFGNHKAPTDKCDSYDIARSINLENKETSAGGSATSDGYAEKEKQGPISHGKTAGLSSEIDSAVEDKGGRRERLVTTPSVLTDVAPAVNMGVPGRVSGRGFAGPAKGHVVTTGGEEGISHDHNERPSLSNDPPTNEDREPGDVGVVKLERPAATRMTGGSRVGMERQSEMQRKVGGGNNLVSAATEEWVIDQRRQRRRLLEMERETDEQEYRNPATNETVVDGSHLSLVELVAAIEDPEMRRLSALAYLA
ncbi:hypothetical protein FRC17_004903 [Serendipita sp. 399]|nr:hypothetical protein FRC17_004903 [Serendipita sp. 399]